MRRDLYQVFLINKELRTTFQELQSFLGVVFDQSEIDQLFIDAENDQVSYKIYSFYRAPSFFFNARTITGAVEEYEPDTLFLKSEGGIGKRTKFESFFAIRQHS